MAPRHSHYLAGFLPSTSPPPLGERPRQSRQTISHIDSHTMGDHLEGIPEPPSPIHVDVSHHKVTKDAVANVNKSVLQPCHYSK